MNNADNKFRPFRSLKHEKTLSNNHDHKWEDTAATPPVYKHDHVVPIPIEESLGIQVQTEEKLKVYEKIRFIKFHPRVNQFYFLEP